MPTAEFYRERAREAQLAADGAILENVRMRHIVARDSWTEMAVKADGVVQAREKREAEQLANAALNLATAITPR
ncbi:hypothetical protein MCEREM21A_01856 [Sphingomonadaceae bacterium]|jgi:hypothetical protein|nr:hypothetical protein [Sphingorhabdus sp.]MCE2829706.1 hypothetical protein [Sphingomonadales bacterium]WRH76164.1 MAG: hypothetical protein RSE16_01445 [Sphingobium sp.]